VLADPTRLKQVLVNLLNNAAKYNRVGGSIGVECRPRPNHRLRIRVTDTGQGIGAAHLGKLFVPFERLGVEKRGIDGTGIGLALCKQMVEMMGGEIGVDSHEGVGSTFWIELPASDELSEPPTRNGVARLEAQQRVHTVVYVEDNPTNLRLVQSLFRHYPQLALTAASTGEQGLALIERIQPDLVVLDIHLPGIDGYGVLQAMREHPSLRHIPAIALSADAMPDDIERGLRAGFRRYLTKPLNMEQFMQAIAELTTGAD
jgi:CheY-like chemotaxis protein